MKFISASSIHTAFSTGNALSRDVINITLFFCSRGGILYCCLAKVQVLVNINKSKTAEIIALLVSYNLQLSAIHLALFVL